MARASGSQNWRSWVVEQYNQERRQGKSAREAWEAIKRRFLEAYTSGDAGQAWKNYSGRALEEIVKREFDSQIIETSIGARVMVKRWEEMNNAPLVKQILSETLWLRGELREPYLAESQVDFIAIEHQNNSPLRVLAVYSCKASLRERFQQDLFWTEKLRARGIRFCLITLDNDGVLQEAVAEGRLESKQAKMAAALYDRIYLLSDEPIQHFQRVFRTIDALAEDLKRWWEAG